MDRSLFEWMNRLAGRTGWAHGVLRFYAGAGVLVFAALLLVAFLLARHGEDSRAMAASVWAAAAAVVAMGIGQVIGAVVDRARPYDTLAHVHLLVGRTTDASFPSDHATVVGAVAAGLFFVSRRLGLMAGVLAVAMAFTRVYVGAHYPLDVVAGLALGAGVALAGWRLVLAPLQQLVGFVSRTRLRWVVAPSVG